MRSMLIAVSTCCFLVVTLCPAAWAGFDLISPATETDACVYAITANTAKIVFTGWESAETIATSDDCVIALKHVAAVQSVNSADALVSGFGVGLFSFTAQASCSNEFTTLFGSTATAFSSTPSLQVPANRATDLEFVVTLKAGKTITDLANDLDTGNALIYGGFEPLGGSPVAGSGRSGSGSLLAPLATAVCLEPGAVTVATDVVTNCTLVPTLDTWGIAVVIALILGLGTFVVLRNRQRLQS